MNTFTSTEQGIICLRPDASVLVLLDLLGSPFSCSCGAVTFILIHRDGANHCLRCDDSQEAPRTGGIKLVCKAQAAVAIGTG